MNTAKVNPYEHVLSDQQIMDRLFDFNVLGDWSVFNDVPPIQQVSVMYPHAVLSISLSKSPSTPESRLAELIERFKPSQETIEKVKEIARLRTQS